MGLFFGMFQLLEVAHITDMGKLPAASANYLANKRGSAGRTPVSSPPSMSPQGHPKGKVAKKKPGYNFAAAQKKLGVVS